jgi:uncharacterized protein (DUF736 family)
MTVATGGAHPRADRLSHASRKDHIMAHIGQFTRTPEGFIGRLSTAVLDLPLAFVPADASDADNAPDFRLHAGDDGDGPEVGAGWKRTGEKAGDYVSVVIDDPSFAQPIHANLFQPNREEGTYALVWNRPAKRAARS